MPLPEDEDPELSQLLREQEAFFRDRARPAAKLVVHPKREAEDKLTDDASMREGIGGQGSVQEMKERPQAILGGIVERSGGSNAVCQPIKITAGPKLGFPKADLRRKDVARRPRPVEKSVQFSTPAPPVPPLPQPPVPRSREVDGVSLDEIHAENLRRLAAMDMEEVAAAQQEILSMLSPEAIEMLRSSQASSGALLPPPQKARRGTAEEEKRRASEEARRAELMTRRIDSEEALARAARELLSEEEREPIDWFNTPPAERTQEEGGAEAVIRLDLEGRVIEAARAGDIPAHSGLYHNPEQCAGYTLQQLCDIGHSSDQAQRATAFRTWAMLLRCAPTLERVEREGVLVPSELPIVLLAGLEDRHLAARLNALSAMEALVVSDEDGREREEAFDAAQGDVGWPPSCGPIKLVRYPAKGKGEKEREEEEEKDEEEEEGEKKAKDPLAQQRFHDTDSAVRAVLQDPAVGLVRCGLLPRLTQLLTDGKADAAAANAALQLLCWLAGRSSELAERIADLPGLLRHVEAGALQGGRAELRLLRVLAQGSRKVCLAMGGRGTLRASKGVLSLRHVASPAKIEALRLWRVALGYGADLESLLDVLQLLARPEEEGHAYKLCKGVWVPWGGDDQLLAALYRALEAACLLFSERARQGPSLGGIMGEVHLDADVVGECGMRLRSTMATLLGGMRERPSPAMALLSSQAHFLAACVEGGLAAEAAGEAVQIVTDAAASAYDGLLKSAASVKRAMLAVDATVSADDVAGVDLLLALVRLWSAGLRGGLPPTTTACALTGLQRVNEALDLGEEWRQAAASPAASSAVIQGYTATRSVRRQHARRLLVAAEHLTLTTLASAGGEMGQLAAQARRLVPICGPGSEHACLQLMMLGGLADKPSLATMYQQVILGGRASHPRLLQCRDQPSCLTTLLLHPSLHDPAPLLPLPYHWLLSPLVSQGGSDHALTTRLLRDCLSLLASTPSYTSQLPPAVLLYHLLSLCLFPPEVIADRDITTSFFTLAPSALARLPPGSLQPQLAQAALTLQPLGGLSHQGAGDSLHSFVADLLEACQEGAHGLEPHSWALRLLLHPVLDADLRLHVWKDLKKTSLLHLLDPPAGHDDDVRRLLDPLDRDPEMLDCYCQALGSRYYPPLTLDRGGLALVLATHHLAADVAAVAGHGMREAQRRRWQRLVAEAQPEVLDLLLIQALRAVGGGQEEEELGGTYSQRVAALERVQQRVREQGWPTASAEEEKLAAVILEGVGTDSRAVVEEKCPWFVQALCLSQ